VSDIEITFLDELLLRSQLVRKSLDVGASSKVTEKAANLDFQQSKGQLAAATAQQAPALLRVLRDLCGKIALGLPLLAATC
jgi:hypothetical protein